MRQNDWAGELINYLSMVSINTRKKNSPRIYFGIVESGWLRDTSKFMPGGALLYPPPAELGMHQAEVQANLRPCWALVMGLE